MQQHILHSLIEEHIHLLDQLRDLVNRLTVDSYRYRDTVLASGCIGSHIRHIVDHYTMLLQDRRFLDYDARERLTDIELCPLAAERALTHLPLSLEGLTQGDADPSRLVSVHYHPDTRDPGDPVHLWSTLGRELTFVFSHTLHHMALIGVLAKQQGVRVPGWFGVARATRAYRTGAAEQSPVHSPAAAPRTA